jgi:hypothetical protein
MLKMLLAMTAMAPQTAPAEISCRAGWVHLRFRRLKSALWIRVDHS